nr:hypothetical protein [Tanacetum cinerariifolium]
EMHNEDPAHRRQEPGIAGRRIRSRFRQRAAGLERPVCDQRPDRGGQEHAAGRPVPGPVRRHPAPAQGAFRQP